MELDDQQNFFYRWYLCFKSPVYLRRASCAVNLFLGSRFSIFLTKSFALSEILGQGSDEKSSSPFRTWSNIPCSVSAKGRQIKEHRTVQNCQKQEVR